MLRAALLALLLTPPPAPISGAGDVPCARCDGAGVVVQDCWLCGDGDHACNACRRFAPRRTQRWSAGWIPASKLELLNEDLRKQIGELKLPELKLPGQPRKSPKPTEIDPGELRCPARCRGGELLLVDDWVDCLLCKRGKFRCDFCRKGERECERCDGKGKAPDGCPDCAGTGALPDLADLSPEDCPWCRGNGRRRCGSCDAEGKVDAICLDCLGHGERPCGECQGIGRVRCSKCGGRGRHGMNKAACPECSKKGAFDCRACDGGRVDCDACLDGRIASTDCPHCEGTREHPCNGCTALGYAPWEQAADRAADAGAPEGAAAWLGVARERCERRYELALAANDRVEDEEARERYAKAIEKELASELRRLDARAKELERAGSSAAGR